MLLVYNESTSNDGSTSNGGGGGGSSIGPIAGGAIGGIVVVIIIIIIIIVVCYFVNKRNKGNVVLYIKFHVTVYICVHKYVRMYVKYLYLCTVYARM